MSQSDAGTSLECAEALRTLEIWSSRPPTDVCGGAGLIVPYAQV
ncbi:MAG: hypothetical protein ABSD67_00700 [Terracidiphilus sp.]